MFGVYESQGLKLDFFPFIAFNNPSSLAEYLSTKILFFVILYKVIFINILANTGIKIIDEITLLNFFL